MGPPFSDNREWRCSECVYNPSRTGVRSARPMVSEGGAWMVSEDEDLVVNGTVLMLLA
jgi:hypothetical protein